VGDVVKASVDEEQRKKTAVNHTATHLLNYALRKVLGKHINQAGSLVSPERLRFDFTHFQATTPQELDRIEEIVNGEIAKNRQARTYTTSLEDARSKGVITLPGEKYADVVRVMEITGVSKELCGGTHLHNTGDIRLFKILSEESVAAGVRRITALTGDEALKEIRNRENILREVSQLVRAAPEELEKRVTSMQQEIKQLKKDLQAARHGGAKDALGEILSSAVAKGQTKIASGVLEGFTPDDLRRTLDTIRAKEKSVAAILASRTDAKVHLILGFSKDLVAKGLNAGALIKELAKIVGGGGGGRADMAQAGGTIPEKIEEALQAGVKKISQSLGS
jgi:alanyl-tRNA synthetase